MILWEIMNFKICAAGSVDRRSGDSRPRPAVSHRGQNADGCEGRQDVVAGHTVADGEVDGLVDGNGRWCESEGKMRSEG